MKRRYSEKSSKEKDIAIERINALFSEAKEAFNKNPGLSNRYVSIARKIAMKLKVRMPAGLKRKFCSHCHCYLVPGTNCRVRSNEGKMVYYCFGCKGYMRFPYIKEKKAKAKN